MEIKYINLFRGIDLGERKLPILIEKGKEAGPAIWLCAGIHGDEINGIEVIHRIFNYLKRNPLKRGALYGLPIINPAGFEMIKRENPYDNQDINRNFPGDKNGGTTERLANAIFNSILETKPELVIDLHADTQKSIPHIIVDRPLNSKNEVKEAIEKSWNLAEKFGITVVYDIEVEGYKKYNLDKSLGGALMNRNQIPTITVELGGPRVIDEKFVRMGVNGFKNILKHFQMVDGKEKLWLSEAKIKTSGRLELIENITCSESGIIEFLVKPGQFVKKGQALAKITNILGKIEEIIMAAQDYYVMSLDDYSVSFPGSTILSVAVLEKKEGEKIK